MKQKWLVSGLVLLVVAAVALFLFNHLEWHEHTVRGKASAEALSNRWHAGRLLLAASGIETTVARGADVLEHLPRRQTILLSGLDRFAEPELRDRLLEWVDAGGHLVLPLSLADRNKALLNALGISIEGTASARNRLDGDKWTPEQKLHVETADYLVRISGARTFTLSADSGLQPVWQSGLQAQPSPDDEDDLAPDDDEEAPEDAPDGSERSDDARPAEADIAAAADKPRFVAIYGRFRYGKGWITTGSFDAFDNEHIGRHDHAPLFLRLMTLPDGPRAVTMITLTPYDGLWRWLASHAPEALFIAALMLVAWLRRRMPRFGPLLPEPAPVRPGLREHLAASGQYLLREGCCEALLAPMRESVQRQLESLAHRHPDIASAELLGEHVSGIPAAEIRRALATVPDNPHEFLRSARVLATLRQRSRALTRSSGVQA